MPYRKSDFGVKVRSSPSEGKGLLTSSAESVTEAENILSEIIRTAVYELDETTPHISP